MTATRVDLGSSLRNLFCSTVKIQQQTKHMSVTFFIIFLSVYFTFLQEFVSIMLVYNFFLDWAKNQFFSPSTLGVWVNA